MKAVWSVLIWTLFAAFVSAAEVKVASLHPLLSDLLKRVGGERVEVVDLLGQDGDPHKFEPTAKDLQAAQGAQLYFVSGKGLEPYLGKLEDIVGKERVVEVGRDLPTLRTKFLCDHGEDVHVHEEEDPHWWHSLDCWRRAAYVVAGALGRADPEHASEYRERAKAVRKEFSQLRRWVEEQLGRVPEAQRTLATAHAAFGYFCNEYGWQMLPVQGLNREQVAAPKFVSEVAEVMRQEDVKAVFPEKRSNPKMLKTLAEGVGVPVGGALMADGGDSIEKMFRHNVAVIVAALAPPDQKAE